MKKILYLISITGTLGVSACSNEKTGINNESGNSGTVTESDSATTNPVNSEYGTPNATENTVDSAQNAN